MQVDVRIAAQAALLHLAIGDFQIAKQQADLLEICLRLLRAAHLGLADDLQQRRAGTIQIDQAILAAALLVVHHLAGVLLEMDANDANPFRSVRGGDLEPAIATEREVVLADLVVLRQVGIVIVLAVPLGERSDGAAQRERRLEGEVERPAVHDGQRAGQAGAYGTGGRVRRQAKLSTTAAKELGARQQLDVDFQADDDSIWERRRFAHGVIPRGEQ